MEKEIFCNSISTLPISPFWIRYYVRMQHILLIPLNSVIMWIVPLDSIHGLYANNAM